MSMSSLDRIKRSHVAIMRHSKFCAFAGVLACGKVTVSPTCPTAKTNGWDVVYGDAFVQALTPAELNMLVLHEATHKAYRHLGVWKSLWEENPGRANLAADHFVNLTLIDLDAGEGFVKMPAVGVQPNAKYRGWSVRQIYEDLKQQGQGDDYSFDEHEPDEDDDPTKQEEVERSRAQEIDRALRQGEAVRRKRSAQGAGGADGVFGDLLTPKVDWRKLLREFLVDSSSGRDESSWARPNRRFLSQGIYMPSLQGDGMRELVIGFDTSGSCFGGEDMARFVTEVKSVIESVNPDKVHIIYWDTRVAGHDTFEDGGFEVNLLQPKGGGGTDGSVLFDYLRDKQIDPVAIVQLSDGYVGDWGVSTWPTLWALVSDLTAPYGTTINIKE